MNGTKISFIIKQSISSIIAFVIGFFIVNSLFMLYYHQPAWFERSNAATRAIWNPNSFITNLNEGFGFNTVDRNGYVNPNLPLVDKGYILALGSSYTQGRQVKMGQKYTSILNDKFTNKDELVVYNMAQDGGFYASIIKGFKAAITEFPNSSAVIIEFVDTNISYESLLNSIDQESFSLEKTGSELKQSLSLKDDIKHKIVECFPLLMYLKNIRFKDVDLSHTSLSLLTTNASESEEVKDEYVYDISYTNAVDKTLELISSEYDGEIILVYHQGITLNYDGTITVKSSKLQHIFEELTPKYQNITFLSMDDAYYKAYQELHVLPYGYWNTSYEGGHMNSKGYEIMANEIYQKLQEVGYSYPNS
jgi:hypothetical protein